MHFPMIKCRMLAQTFEIDPSKATGCREDKRMPKVNKKNIRKTRKLCLKFAIKTPNFEDISHPFCSVSLVNSPKRLQ